MKAKLKKILWENPFLIVNLLLVSLLTFYAIYAFPSYHPFPEITGYFLSKLLNYIGIESFSQGELFTVEIKGLVTLIHLSAECSGIALFLMFLIVILILPEYSFYQKMIAVPFVILLFFANVFRILAGILLSKIYGASALIIFHDTIGQAIIFLAVISSFILWLKIVKKFPKEETYHEEMNY